MLWLFFSNSFFLDLIEREHAIDKAKTIFIGDNLHTDISFAANLGIRSVFVTGGVSKLEDMENSTFIPRMCPTVSRGCCDEEEEEEKDRLEEKTTQKDVEVQIKENKI